MSEELLSLIEKVFNIKFYEWQKKYLLNEPMLLDMRITGRTTGKTFVFIIKLLFESDELLDLRSRNETLIHSDWWCCENRMERALGSHYIRWYKNYLKEIYEKLNTAGIKTREVIF